MFYCTTYNCQFREETCIKYQEAVLESKSGWIKIQKNEKRPPIIINRSHCADCSQGKEIQSKMEQSLPRWGPGLDVPPDPLETGITLQQVKDEVSKLVVPFTRNDINERLNATTDTKKNRINKWLQKLTASGNISVLSKTRTEKGGLINNYVRSPFPYKAAGVVDRNIDGERATDGHDLPIPVFETELIVMISRKTGKTIDDVILDCIRSGIKDELKRMEYVES